MLNRTLILLLALVALSWVSCTTKRDGRGYRLFHPPEKRLLCNEAHREADLKLQEIHEERWDEMLPFFEADQRPLQHAR